MYFSLSRCCVTINSCYETCTFVGITKFHLIRTEKKSKGYLATEQHEHSQ